MSSGNVINNDSSSESAHFRTLTIIAVLSTCLYGIISLLSWRFDYESAVTLRPIVAILLLFAALVAGYLFAIRVATQGQQDRKLLRLIVWFAVVFRVVLLFSTPIQEIDIYRYLWDGAVSTTGVSPFRYSPDRVRAAANSSPTDEDLRKIVRLLDREPALVEILNRVHYGELPTIYPPVSQVVFTAAAHTTPNSSSVMCRVYIMKAWLIGFDLATLLVVVGLLKLCRKPIGLSIIYAWCPLLMKEFANSGHLDAIAVFFSALSIYLAARFLVSLGQSACTSTQSIMVGLGSAVVLALAVGAKLYPIVLAPLMFFVFVKNCGWTKSLIPAAAFVAVTLLVVWPLLPRDLTSSATGDVPPTAESTQPEGDPSLGVTTFLRRWEMNDFIFLVIFENLKPESELPPDRIAWFSIIPESFRQSLTTHVGAWCNLDPREAPFLIARAITALAFFVVIAGLAWWATRANDVSSFCEAGFLTLAWFWLLCPTQNPWYWTWAMPLLPFARSRTWLAVSGLVFLYYLRFWFGYQWPNTPVMLEGDYVGVVFFDFVITWIEFAPWLLCLTVGFVVHRNRLAARRDSL